MCNVGQSVHTSLKQPRKNNDSNDKRVIAIIRDDKGVMVTL